jgi:hypothetical protein
LFVGSKTFIPTNFIQLVSCTSNTDKGNERLNLFARTIHAENVFEYMTVRLRDSPVLINCDSHNCSQDGWSHAIAINREVLVAGRPMQLIVLGTGRQSIASHMERQLLYFPIVQGVTNFYQNLDIERKTVSNKTLHPQDNFLSEEEPLIQDANASRIAIYVASIAHMIDCVRSHYRVPCNAPTDHPLVNMLLIASIMTENRAMSHSHY